MSTCNFSYPNTKVHYTIGVDEDMDEWDYDSSIKNIQAELELIGGVDCDKWTGRDARRISEFSFSVYDHEYKSWDNVYLYVTVESGYYAGAMFDIDNEDLEQVDICKTTRAKIDKTWDKIEAVLKNNTVPMIRTAVFSNGEAVYQLAK